MVLAARLALEQLTEDDSRTVAAAAAAVLGAPAPAPPEPARPELVLSDTVIDLAGTIGRHVLDALMPDRRLRLTPRVVKRAISNYAAKTATGRIHGPSYHATINIDILTPADP